MADLPAENRLPPLPAPNKEWFNEDGTPTVEFARYMHLLRIFLQEQRDFIAQEHP